VSANRDCSTTLASRLCEQSVGVAKTVCFLMLEDRESRESVGMLAPKRCKHGTPFDPIASGDILNSAKARFALADGLPRFSAG
jgi:hypothetical protein